MPSYQDLLLQSLNNMGKIDTTTTTLEDPRKYEEKFNLAGLLQMLLMLLGDDGFQNMLGLGKNKGTSTSANYGVNLSGLSGDSGIGSTTPGGF